MVGRAGPGGPGRFLKIVYNTGTESTLQALSFFGGEYMHTAVQAEKRKGKRKDKKL